MVRSNKRHWWQHITSRSILNQRRNTSGSPEAYLTSPIAESFSSSSHSSSSLIPIMAHNNSSEHSPLLRHMDQQHDSDDEVVPHTAPKPNFAVRRMVVWGILTVVMVVALVVLLRFEHTLPDVIRPWFGLMPRDPTLAALAILKVAPVIDGHIDLPILVRQYYANNISAVDLQSPMFGHVDIPRLRQGKVGGFFWSVYVGCPELKNDMDFTEPSWSVRDTLEQIDVARSLINKYPDTFQHALSSEDITTAITDGKIASILGVEGGHQLGNSISVLRQYYHLGARYVTLTHTCHNAFSDSSAPSTPLHNGLSPIGLRLIDEMNRLGMLVDLSHTSDETARQALNHSKAPVIWSHSSARAVHNVQRNVPDDILRLVGTDASKKDALIMVNFVPEFLSAPGNASVVSVADHIEHIARITGKDHVGLGSDYDGMIGAPSGLEDVSKYPVLIAVLYRRGWNKYELAALTGGNLLRVFKAAERVAKQLQDAHTIPVYDLYDKRTDIPRHTEDL